MDECKRLSDTWLVTGNSAILDEIAGGIATGHFTLLALIKCLREPLTAEAAILRGKGVTLLTAVLQRVVKQTDRQSTRVLVDFYCNQLEDSETVIPGLEGLLVLAESPLTSAAEGLKIFESVQRDVKMRGLVQSVRYTVFKIVDVLLARFRNEMRKMAPDFIRGWTSLVEGEKDPRNLTLIFAINRVVLVEFDIRSHVEDLHDIIFCYFPITFKPPPNDPYGISSDDLRQALRSNFAATPLFGPLAVPLFLEKLSAPAAAVKRDALQTMSSSLPVYGRSLALKFADPIWNAAKIEIFQPIDRDTEKDAIEAVKTLILTCQDPAGKAPIARDILTHCLNALREPEKTQAQYAVKLLAALVSTSGGTATEILQKASSHLISLLADPAEASHRKQVISHLAQLTEGLRTARLLDMGGDVAEATAEYKTQLLSAFVAGLKSAETQGAALNGLTHLSAVPNYVQPDEMRYLVNEVNDLLSSQLGSVTSREAVLRALVEISGNHPTTVEEQTLPLLFTLLPDAAPEATDTELTARYQVILQCLSALCIPPPLFEMLVIRLSTKLDLMGDLSIVRETDAAYVHAMMVCLDTALRQKATLGHVDTPKHAAHLLKSLFQFADKSLEPHRSAFRDERLRKVVDSVVTALVRTLTEEQQSSVILVILSSLHTRNLDALANWRLTTPVPTPITVGPLPPNWATVHLYCASIIPLRPKAVLPIANLDDFLLDLMAWFLLPTTPPNLESFALRIVASVVNKKAEVLDNFLDREIGQLWGSVISPETSEVVRRKSLRGWTEIHSALVARSNPLAVNAAGQLMGLLKDPILGRDAAEAIGSIITPNDALSKANHATLKVLYVQKYVSVILPAILRGAKDPQDPELQTSYLIAFSSIIKYLPPGMVVVSAPAFMPLLIMGLDLQDSSARTSITNALFMLAKDENPPTAQFEQHVSSLITKLLANTLPSSSSTSALRIASLKCLGVLPNAVSYTQLHPHRSLVLRQLGQGLDDRKRDVRGAAVDTRDVWFAVHG